jgi:hypothetical protein
MIRRRWRISKWDNDETYVDGPIIEPEEDGLTGMDWVNAAVEEVLTVDEHLFICETITRSLSAVRVDRDEWMSKWLRVCNTEQKLARELANARARIEELEYAIEWAREFREALRTLHPPKPAPGVTISTPEGAIRQPRFEPIDVAVSVEYDEEQALRPAAEILGFLDRYLGLELTERQKRLLLEYYAGTRPPDEGTVEAIPLTEDQAEATIKTLTPEFQQAIKDADAIILRSFLIPPPVPVGQWETSTSIEFPPTLNDEVMKAFHDLIETVEKVWPKLRNPAFGRLHEPAPIAGAKLRIAAERAKAVIDG